MSVSCRLTTVTLMHSVPILMGVTHVHVISVLLETARIVKVGRSTYKKIEREVDKNNSRG